MEITIEAIVSLLGLFVGGGGGAFFTWKFMRRKAKAEAQVAEIDAAKELQDVYQQLINDIKVDREEQKAYIVELKEDRHHLRAERDDLRRRQDSLEEVVRRLQREVASNANKLEMLRPLLCGRDNCAIRVPVPATVSGIEESSKKPKPKRKEVKDEGKLDIAPGH